MALLNLESLVLRGNGIAQNGVAGQVRNGSSSTAIEGTTTTPLSPTRHPYLDNPPSMARDMRRAYRAGRSGCQAGVLNRRRSAICADQAILSGWSHSRKGALSASAWPTDYQVHQPTGQEETTGCLGFPRTRVFAAAPKRLADKACVLRGSSRGVSAARG